MFDNPYQPENPMQKIYESTVSYGCLCSMRESCSVCSSYGERSRQRELIKQIAFESGYQLYSVHRTDGQPHKLEMEKNNVFTN